MSPKKYGRAFSISIPFVCFLRAELTTLAQQRHTRDVCKQPRPGNVYMRHVTYLKLEVHAEICSVYTEQAIPRPIGRKNYLFYARINNAT